jgi:hypothetical protein
MVFTARVMASGSAEHWKAGFLQAVTESHWEARYSNNKVLRWRLNTTRGPLKDGNDESSIFMTPEQPFPAPDDQGRQTLAVRACDSPALLFFKEYSGDPFHPTSQVGGEGHGKLIRTEGKTVLHTYLAVANDRRKSVVTLGKHCWTLAWDGTLDFDACTWQSDDIARFLSEEGHDEVACYENLTAASTTPFSLFLETAIKSWEVETADGWVQCKDCLPELDPPGRPTCDRWVK